MTEYRSLAELGNEVELESRRHREAAKWCEEHFGQRWQCIDNRTGLWTMFWSGRGVPPRYRFQFVREQDMMMFMLRWL